MLQKLLYFGIDNGYFELEKMGCLDKSCCQNSRIDVIDFDKTKEFVSKKFSISLPKSCDALIISPSKNELTFIEMKGFQEFIKRLPENPIECDEKIEKQVEGFNLSRKIKDSWYVFESVSRDNKLGLSNKERDQIEDIQKNYFVVTDINVEQAGFEIFATSMFFLSETSNIEGKVVVELEGALECSLNGLGTTTFNKPKLFSCESFERYCFAHQYNQTNLVLEK